MLDGQLEPIIPTWDHLPDLTWKEKLAYLTFKLLEQPQTECPLEHIFEDGTYIREMRIPAGTLFLGRAHRYGHECQLVSGIVLQVTETGRRVVEAPFTVHTTPGYHMVMFTLTDIVGRTVHPHTGDKNTQRLEDDIFESVESLKDLGSIVHQRLESKCLA